MFVICIIKPPDIIRYRYIYKDIGDVSHEFHIVALGAFPHCVSFQLSIALRSPITPASKLQPGKVLAARADPALHISHNLHPHLAHLPFSIHDSPHLQTIGSSSLISSPRFRTWYSLLSWTLCRTFRPFQLFYPCPILFPYLSTASSSSWQACFSL